MSQDSQDNDYDFMSGSCHIFAILKNRELNTKRFLVLLDRTEEYSSGIFAVNHVYALTDDNKAIDAHGVHNPDNIIQQYMDDMDYTLDTVEYDSQGDIEDIEGNPHTNDFGGRVDPLCLILYGEEALKDYVASSPDSWDKPLEHYDDKDLKRAEEQINRKKSQPQPSFM